MVAPILPGLSERRVSVKFASGVAGSRFVRIFWFDTKQRKYRYLHSAESTKDQEDKAKELSQCKYEITSHEYPGTYEWDREMSEYKFRLVMTFKKRPAGPIFFYSNNLDEIRALKNYGVFCRLVAGRKNPTVEARFERLLSSLWYKNAVFSLKHLIKTFEPIMANSIRVYRGVKTVETVARYLVGLKESLMSSWAHNIIMRTMKFRPRSTMRLSLYLQSFVRLHNSSEKEIHRAARRILSAYERERMISQGILDKAIQEKATRRFNGIKAYSVYEVSPEIQKFIKDGIPGELRKFTKFDFPADDFAEPDTRLKIDYKNYRLAVTSSQGEDHLTLPVDDISSIVIDEAPHGVQDLNHKWLKVNGRKIKKPERFRKVWSER